MRDLFSKLMTGTAIAGAALLVSACGGTEEANTVDNTTVTDMNAMDPMLDGTTTDNMTAVDGAMGNDGMMANDMADNGMMANDTMGNMSNDMANEGM